MTPIVDTHQHLWDLNRFTLPWLPLDGPLTRSHTMADYLEAALGLPLTKTVYMEVAVTPSQQREEAAYVLDLCRRDDNPMAGAVIGGDPASPDFEAYLNATAQDHHVKGVRHSLPTDPAGDPRCLREEYLRGLRMLGERGLSFDLLTSSSSLPVAAQVARACPDTRFILDHCGNPDVQATDRSEWQRGIEELAAEPHVLCKISGIVASARPGAWSAEDLEPFVTHCADAFGRDRIVFGSDWPVCTRTASLREWVEALTEIVSGWSESDRRKLFYENAVRYYRL
ncbi:MAG: amidohydrolase family protein [Armatimonadetes bacterium]|nr:amidohydrolase family protein [Armatimonadota bacterium]